MAIANVFETGRSGMVAAKAAISTAGHNIANAKTDGYSRQTVHTAASEQHGMAGSHAIVGTGTTVSRIDRFNDEYIEKQLRGANRDISHMEEKELLLKQTEDVFNEMNGDGLNRVMSRFFNEFRKLSNDPDNEAIRQSVREASQAMVNDFHRLRHEVDDIRKHADSRLEGQVREVNSLAEKLRDVNVRIQQQEMSGAPANDLQDKRDVILKDLAAYAEVSTHKDGFGNVVVELKGVGPIVVGPEVQKFITESSPEDGEGKVDGALDLKSTATTHSVVTHTVKGGKMGAVLDVRDNTLSSIADRLDELAFSVTEAVNAIHEQGYSRTGRSGVSFFENLGGKDRAAEFLELSEDVRMDANNIASAAIPDSPGDNRVAIAISGLQNMKLMHDGKSSVDDFYNSIVSDVGVAASKNRFNMNQQRDIFNQLGKMREQISGVSIDEETANLMQFQHAFGASAKVIQVADEMLQTVLNLKR